MKTVFIFVVITLLVLLVIAAIIKSKTGRTENEEWPYLLKKPLSEVEQKFFLILREAFPEMIVLAQVGLWGILDVKKGLTKSERTKYENQIARQRLDFVICSQSFEVVAVIELDDASHERASNKTRDEKKDKALTAAGAKIIRFPVKEMPGAKEVRTAIINKP